MAPKCNSYSSKERTYEYKDLNEKDFRKKSIKLLLHNF